MTAKEFSLRSDETEWAAHKMAQMRERVKEALSRACFNLVRSDSINWTTPEITIRVYTIFIDDRNIKRRYKFAVNVTLLSTETLED